VILLRARCCNGGRHPGPQDADSLRGLSEKRGSWSVRRGCVGLVPTQSVAPATTGVLWKNEEGNVVSMRQAHALSRETPKKRLTKAKAEEDTSFARSRDPCTSIGTELRQRKLAEVSRWSRYRGRANLGNQEETGTGVLITRTNARLAASHRFSG